MLVLEIFIPKVERERVNNGNRIFCPCDEISPILHTETVVMMMMMMMSIDTSFTEIPCLMFLKEEIRQDSKAQRKREDINGSLL